MPKHIKMMILQDCPYCQKAFKIMEELKCLHPEYTSVTVEVIEEDKFPEIADKLDYYYVPTFYVDDEKIMEGIPTNDKVEQVFLCALQ